MTEQTSVGVIGLGYVGLPLALAMADAGYRVVGVDVSEHTVAALNDGHSHISDVDDEELKEHLGMRFVPTTDFNMLTDVDSISICVPTPLRKSGHPDVSYVLAATEQIADVVSPGTTIILESTVYPGATEEIVGNELTERGFVVGEDVFLAFSPERIDPGNKQYGVTDIPKVIGGCTPACTDHAVAIYEPVFKQVVPVESCAEAEFVKLLENTFRSINIALINELAKVAHELSVDIWDVIDAAETKPFGFMPFRPGPGFGGHCIPIDPLYLSWRAKQYGVDTRFIDLADQVNHEMPGYVVDRIMTELNRRGVPLLEADVLVVGVAYKPDVSDMRESPALDVMVELERLHAHVEYHDPYVPSMQIEETEYAYDSVELTPERLAAADCVAILTNHSSLPIDDIVEHANYVFDTRNATDGIDAPHVHRL